MDGGRKGSGMEFWGCEGGVPECTGRGRDNSVGKVKGGNNWIPWVREPFLAKSLSCNGTERLEEKGR